LKKLKNKAKTLITCGYHFSDKQLKKLEGLGCEVVVWSSEKEPVTEEHLDAEILFSYQVFQTTDIHRFTNLKLIQLTSSGLDHVPVQAIRKRGIQLCNARGVYSIPMAEWVVLKTLEIYKKSRAFEAAQARGEWKQHRSLVELYGKTVGVAGTGSIGSEVAVRMKGFGCRVIGLNTSGKAQPSFDQCLPTSELTTFLHQSDVVVLTLPLTEDTRHLLNSETLWSMKDSAVLVNVSRGAVVDEDALLDHLGNGRLMGAALDVFETEPLPPHHDLWRHPKIIATPHNSFLSTAVKDRMYELAYSNIRAFLEGRPLTNFQ
jgi:phosphoglycerate dehydrogenase-like enzyme